ncbi:hypothetical protein [Amycolatopsis sp. DG1A-15b]|uniref:hypothetical protein n=1 Tax=Amycolatopsis sp. DG1A-15b TaxID=3052846 RepID=UPI00255BFB7A|nr:hypothetical protein [Amycolatopsis sp. DG1A-15b]WIX89666.1 hypothetical protein QRY02_04235 [Amycolatopsis sp. DG1A-15b]
MLNHAEPQRSYHATPWADPTAKARWLGGETHEPDFRTGGREVTTGTRLVLTEQGTSARPDKLGEELK